MKLPNRLFFTGVPGSRWSGISQNLELLDGINTSDQTFDREYDHHGFTGHKGAYFGTGMEFEPVLNEDYIDGAWKYPDVGCKIVKSHEWAYHLNSISEFFPDDWIMMVYRPEMSSYAWWHEAGGFGIQYPDYSYYQNSSIMMAEIIQQNAEILEFGRKMGCTWNYFTSDWVFDNFGQRITVKDTKSDILVTLIN